MESITFLGIAVSLIAAVTLAIFAWLLFNIAHSRYAVGAGSVTFIVTLILLLTTIRL